MKIQLLIDASGPEMRHRTSSTAADPFFYIKRDSGEEFAYFGSTDYEEKRLEAASNGSAMSVISLDPYWNKYDSKSGLNPYQFCLFAILKEMDATEIEISGSLPYEWASALEKNGFKISVHDFASERRKKTPREIALMKKVQLVTEKAFCRIKDILSESSIIGGKLFWRYEILTSEILKFEVALIFLKEGCSSPNGIIIASGEQGSRPHDSGKGPIAPHQLIVVDIFPKDDSTGYYADMSRTFCKGKPTEKMQRMYDAVLTVQESAIKSIKSGVSGRVLYDNAVEEFGKLGFPNEGPERGFIHGLGHGLGLAIHEAPRLTEKLLPGDVITVEPGLYYPEIGGVRIEDVLVIHEDVSVENITNFSKELIIP